MFSSDISLSSNARSSFESGRVFQLRVPAVDAMGIHEFGENHSRSGAPPLRIQSVHFTGRGRSVFPPGRARRSRQSCKRISSYLNTTPCVADDDVKGCRPAVRLHEISGFRTHKSEVNFVVVRGVEQVNSDKPSLQLT